MLEGLKTYRVYLESGPRMFTEIALKNRESSWSPRKGVKVRKEGRDAKKNKEGSLGK